MRETGMKQPDGPKGGHGSKSRFFILPLVVLMHVLLALLLIFGLRPPPPAPQTVAMAQITQQKVQVPSRPPPPAPPLRNPEQVEMAAPMIDIAPTPQAPDLITPQGHSNMAASRTAVGTGNSVDAGAVRTATSAEPPPPDPNCETVDAYVTRVRTAIHRFFDYPDRAREERLQGEVMMNFISDPRGRILQSRITSYTVERVYRGRDDGGRYHDLIVSFTRNLAGDWTWQAKIRSDKGTDIPIGSGSVQPGGDGIMRAPERADGMMLLNVPDDVPSERASVSIRFGSLADLLLLEKSAERALRLAQPLPAMRPCMMLKGLNATMPLRLQQVRR